MHYIRLIIILIIFTLKTCFVFGQTFEVVNNDTINRLDKDSLKQGTWRSFFAEGTTKEEFIYKDNKKNGLALTFYRWPNCLKEEATYKNDSLHGYRIQYYRNCKPRLVETFENGVKEGYERTYNKHGIVISEGHFKGGELEGFYKVYDDKGKLKFETTSKETSVKLEEYVSGEKPIKDSVIFVGLNRIKSTGNTVVVTDITGSMYPYVGQLLLWYKHNLETTPIRRFVFFNDGDKKRDMEKEAGKTGGIYFGEPKKLTDLKKQMEKAISGGGGGDAQENDLEAVQAAIRKYNNTDKVILIADRFSFMRDFNLLKKIKVPVHVILCDNTPYTNPQYLSIAKYTGGTLQTIDQEIKNMKDIDERETINISGIEYELLRGQFIQRGDYKRKK